MYLDPVALAELKSLALRFRGLAAAGAPGRHLSSSRGASQDFSEHRPYAPGDETRRVDWKVFARADRYFVRESLEETLLQGVVLVDASGSMAFGGRGPSKWDYACRLAEALAYLIAARGDAAGMALLAQDARVFLPPRASLAQVEAMDRLLSGTAPRGVADFSRCVETVAARLKRRALVLAITDLQGDWEAAMRSLRALRARKHEVALLHVVDARERDFDYEGPVAFHGLETGERLVVDASELAPVYREAMARLLKAVEAQARRAEIVYGLFETDRPWAAALGRFLSRWP